MHSANLNGTLRNSILSGGTGQGARKTWKYNLDIGTEKKTNHLLGKCV